MGFINLSVSTLGGLNEVWSSIIHWFDFIPNFGWMLIFFTVILKLVLSPLDFWQRKVSRASAKKQALLQPELQKINKQFANNPQMKNQKTMELYKRENYNVLGSCLGMLVNMAVTLFIFITLFYALINMSQVNIKAQYETLQDEYYRVYDAIAVEDPTNELTLTYADYEAGQAVLLKYDDIKEGWLWVNNIWRPDNYASIFPSFNEFKGMTALKIPKAVTEGLTGDALTAAKENWWAAQEAEYNKITQIIRDNNTGWNGYLILTILAAVVTYFSVTLTQMLNSGKKKKAGAVVNKNDPNAQINPAAGATKIMKFVLPIIMIFFTLQYSAAFSIYIVTNSLCGVLLSLLFNWMFNKIEEKKKNEPPKVSVSNGPDYRRK